ncbi:hypothetical protein ACTG16_21915 [Aeromonas sp. 23P]|uniref:hypothetical protein n=1 Tax=Aeromonas sp. 23P TaxID=3452716 RepID=UPI003F7ABB7B|nr:hypothetical protein [Aeromonas veronii]
MKVDIKEKQSLLLEAAAKQYGVSIDYLVTRGVQLALLEGELKLKGMRLCCAQEVSEHHFVVKSVIE